MIRQTTLSSITLVLVIMMFLAGCVPVPAPAVPTQPPTPRQGPLVTDTPAATAMPADLWSEIQKRGVLQVGTSADYRPFEYYNRRFRLDGFDIALIREIGKVLGVEVEIKDYAFDGLASALQLGKIDAAISAISVTDQRQQHVDFSNGYYAGKGAAIANDFSPLNSVTNIEQLAQWMVGVQSGSVYEKYLHDALVATNLMPSTNLVVYPDIDQAVQDMKRKRLDVVVLDSQPAESYVQQGGFKLVGQGVNAQAYAIAIPKGADSFRRVLDAALAKVVASGEYATLLKAYLGLTPDQIEPVPTPVPTAVAPATPTTTEPTPAPAACMDDMEYVADLNYDDSNMTAPPVLQPGQAFVKTWRIRNSGTCTWDSTYHLAYASGNSTAAQMGGQPTNINGTVAPGATYDVSINLIAPTQPGVYQGFWQMKNGKGVAFGTKIYVGIQVQAPAPTSVPSPSIQFSVDRNNITAGECAVFTWNVESVKAVYFYSQGQNMEEHGVAGQGTQKECPLQTTTYYLTVVHTDNSSETQAITINVTPPPVDAPSITLFGVMPAQIQPGQCVTLQWSVEGSVQRIDVIRGSTTLWGGAPVGGSLQDCPTGSGTVGYALVAKGEGGESTAQQYISIVAPPTATPPPTAVPPTPVPPTAEPQPPAIVGKNWVLVTYNNGQGGMTSPIAGTQITALFGADGIVKGSDGCSTYNAGYTATADTLSVGLPTTTGMACPDDVSTQARVYMMQLQASQTYQISGSQMTILGASGQKLLQYVVQ